MESSNLYISFNGDNSKIAFAYRLKGESDDEQALRLAPEKCDFTATYTLGATM